MSSHKDFWGRVLSDGDRVAYLSHSRTSSEFCNGVVIGSTANFVKVADNGRITKVSPYKVIKRQEVTHDAK